MLASCLGALYPEERAGVMHTNRPDLLVEVGAEHGTERAGSALRTERERPSATIIEGEHLLFDDVGVGTDAAAEQLRRLDDRRFDGAIAKGLSDHAMGVEQPATGSELVGQDVACSFWGCDLRHWRPSVRACGCGAL